MKRLIAFALTLGLLTGCNLVKLGYAYADFLISWELDAYFDLDGPLEQQASQSAQALVHWHKTTQLPQYMQAFAQADQALAAQEFSSGVKQAMADYKRLRNQLTTRFCAEVANFIVQLSPEQITHLKEKLEKDNKEFSKYLAIPKAERTAKFSNKIIGTIEDWLGELSSPQKQMIVTFIKNQPDIEPLRKKYQLETQHWFFTHLQPDTPKEMVAQWLTQLMTREGSSHAYAQALDQASLAYENFLIHLLATTTLKQQKHFQTELQQWQIIMQELYASGT